MGQKFGTKSGTEIWDRRTDKQTDKQTDGRTDKTRHRVTLQLKREEQLLKLFQMAEKATTKVRKTIKDFVTTCDICRRFKKTPPRPGVAMPKANTINEVV